MGGRQASRDPASGPDLGEGQGGVTACPSVAWVLKSVQAGGKGGAWSPKTVWGALPQEAREMSELLINGPTQKVQTGAGAESGPLGGQY